MEKLLQAEKWNIIKYGFGIKGFVLSMIENALEVTHNQVSRDVIAELIEAGKKTCWRIPLSCCRTRQSR
jgi:putative hydrolase of the HAD superfamily